jgi:hypothetical protein
MELKNHGGGFNQVIFTSSFNIFNQFSWTKTSNIWGMLGTNSNNGQDAESLIVRLTDSSGKEPSHYDGTSSRATSDARQLQPFRLDHPSRV